MSTFDDLKENATPDESWTKVISSKGSWFDLRLRETWEYRNLILLLLYRDIAHSCRQTVLGPFWWVVQPLILCFVYTFVFVYLARVSTDGLPSILFFLSGLTLWMFFGSVIDAGMNVFSHSMSICGRVYVPRMVVYFSQMLKLLLQFGLQLIFLLLCSLYYCYRGEVTLTSSILIALLVPLYLMATGTGIGLFLASLSYRYRDIAMSVPPTMRLLRYFSAVIIPMSMVPAYLHPYFYWNPVIPAIEFYRLMMFGTGTVDPIHAGISVVTTGVFLLIGIIRYSQANRVCMDML